MTWAEAFQQGPGQAENFLAWAGADIPGNRGVFTGPDSTLTVEITGTAETMRNLKLILKEAREAALNRLGLNCEYILSLSKQQAPWESTEMIQTGTVEPHPEIDGFQIGYNKAYAMRQHEDMTLHHPKPGTKAKFLEDPAMMIAPTIAADIADNVLREIP